MIWGYPYFRKTHIFGKSQKKNNTQTTMMFCWDEQFMSSMLNGSEWGEIARESQSTRRINKEETQ